jgi:hypothetical protein
MNLTLIENDPITRLETAIKQSRSAARTPPLRVFIGYDNREPEAFEVCKASILAHASIPVAITKLNERALRHAGIYRRSYSINDAGWKVDRIDGRPLSTEFTFTRFLVPTLCQFEGMALFIDSDFMFRTDIADLFRFNPYAAVSCVQHDFHTHNRVKMDGQPQSNYRRKLWSSLMLYNCGHPGNRYLTPEIVNNESGSYLHQLNWLEDSEIDPIAEDWNWIAGYSQHDNPRAVHFTYGIPTMEGYENEPYADEWMAYHTHVQDYRA